MSGDAVDKRRESWRLVWETCGEFKSRGLGEPEIVGMILVSGTVAGLRREEILGMCHAVEAYWASPTGLDFEAFEAAASRRMMEFFGGCE